MQQQNIKQPVNQSQPDPKKNLPADREHTKEAYEQAESDIEHDPDFMPGNDAEDLDEEESVKLNDDENDLV